MAFTTRQAASEQKSEQEVAAKPSAQLFSDHRASTIVQLKQQQLMHAAQTPLQGMEDEELLQGKFVAQRAEEEESLQGRFAPAQLAEDEELLQGKFVAQRAEEEKLLQGKFATAQLAEDEELLQRKFETAQLAGDEELLQGKFSDTATAQLEEKPNNTGLPNQLKSGIESLSGMSMDSVKVHYNSDKPAQLNAHAYAQGTDIHVAPGQEQHLPHEAWHVVQQAQGRVQPTTQMKAGVPVNDDVGLETEADVMGAKATNIQTKPVSQLKIKMKDSGPAERTDKSGPALSREVAATIARADLTEIENDIRKLETSIENRTTDQKGRSTTSDEYISHQARITLEQSLLENLRAEKRSIPKPKKVTPPPPEPAKKTTTPMSSNPFAALMED